MLDAADFPLIVPFSPSPVSSNFTTILNTSYRLFPQIHKVNKSSVEDIYRFWRLPPYPILNLVTHFMLKNPDCWDPRAPAMYFLRVPECRLVTSQSDTVGQSRRAEPLQTFIILFAHCREWHFTMMAFLCYSFCSHRCRLTVLMVCNRIVLQKMTNIYTKIYSSMSCHSISLGSKIFRNKS